MVGVCAFGHPYNIIQINICIIPHLGVFPFFSKSSTFFHPFLKEVLFPPTKNCPRSRTPSKNKNGTKNIQKPIPKQPNPVKAPQPKPIPAPARCLRRACIDRPTAGSEVRQLLRIMEQMGVPPEPGGWDVGTWGVFFFFGGGGGGLYIGWMVGGRGWGSMEYVF